MDGGAPVVESPVTDMLIELGGETEVRGVERDLAGPALDDLPVGYRRRVDVVERVALVGARIGGARTAFGGVAGGTVPTMPSKSLVTGHPVPASGVVSTSMSAREPKRIVSGHYCTGTISSSSIGQLEHDESSSTARHVRRARRREVEHEHAKCIDPIAMRRRFLFAIFPSLVLIASACNDGNGTTGPSETVSPAAPSPQAGSGATRDGGTAPLDAATPDSTPGTSPDAEPSGPARVDLVGRFDTRDPAGPKCAWPGCRIVARFKGTSVSARLSEITEDWMMGGPSEWDVSIDGQLLPKIVTTSNAGPKDYVLASGLPDAVHVVELYKRSEAQNGTTQFLGYDLGGGELLAPPVRKARKIEIIGDSQPAAFGVEGVGQGPMCPGLNYAAQWQNFRKSFGAKLGEGLNAEVFGTVYSGKGMVKNIWHPDPFTMPMLFPRTLPTDPNSAWDFSTYVPDVVIIMMGGNDFAVGQPADTGPATLAQFTDAYDAFVVTVRQKYPAAHVFLVTSPSVSDEQPPDRYSRTNVMAGIDGVVSRRHGAGDTKVYSATPPVAAPSELTGCEGHGSPQFHQRVANDLAPLIRAKTGW